MSEFIEWGGGERPIPGLTKVELQFRGIDFAYEFTYAQEVDWFHSANTEDEDFDIVGYRILEDQGSEWIVWNGGENPVPGQRVEAIFRGFTYVYELDSEDFDWTHQPDDPTVDIVLYRPVVE